MGDTKKAVIEEYIIGGEHVNRYQYRLLDCIDKMHCMSTWASDPMLEEKCKTYLKFLEARLQHWWARDKRDELTQRWDCAVKALLEASIAEFKAWVVKDTPWRWEEM